MSIATNRGDIQLPTEVSQEILQKAQESSAIMKLSRQVTLPGNGLTIPMITGDPEAGWVDETNPKPVSNPTLSKKVMQAYKLAVIEPFSDEFRRDTTALYDALIARLPGALSKKFDETVIGKTAAPGGNFDTFAACTAQNIGTNAYGGLVAADIDIATHGGTLNGFALSPQARGILLSALDKNDRPIFVNNVADGAIPVILGHPTYASKGVYKDGSPTDIVGIAGDWSQAMFGTVEGVKISFSSEATLTYNVTSVQTATFNLFQNNMFAVRAEIEVGFRADTNCFNLLTRTHS